MIDKQKITIQQFFTLFIIAVFIAACAEPQEKIDAQDDTPIQQLMNEANKALEDQEYQKAAKLFEEVDRQYPYSDEAYESQIQSAWAYYLSGEYDIALVLLERFVKEHPSSQYTPFAYYVRGLCYYDQISDTKRDQANTIYAYQAFEELVKRFPDSEFTQAAQLKIDLALEHLAGKEVEIGRFYQKSRKYLAAINRFQHVVDVYSTTLHVEEALYRLVETYLILGLNDEAVRVASVLGYNFPGSSWYLDAYTLLKNKVQIEDIEQIQAPENYRKSWF